MTVVFELIKGPQRRLTLHYDMAQGANLKALELQATMEILTKVFNVRLSNVDEIIRSHFKNEGSKEDGLWPREFWLIPNDEFRGCFIELKHISSYVLLNILEPYYNLAKNWKVK